jgi:hypothetical protein
MTRAEAVVQPKAVLTEQQESAVGEGSEGSEGSTPRFF